MFKGKSGGSFASKIAHTTTLPALGNKDLKLLQDVITNEKTVLSSLQRLAVDFTRASESLKSWGLGEGEDLGDVLSHATNIYAHISAALNNFANHEHTVRAHLKSIRSREEKLDETKRKRKGVAAKADAADKKLSKMSGENKNLPAQTDLLNKLRDEIRQLDTDIMVEEARLGDFKRMSTRNFMALKLGGLLEFGEKATIVGELGKLLIEEIPLDPTPPGQPRSFYQAHPKTESLDAEVSRCIGEVVFIPPPDVAEGSAPTPALMQQDALSQGGAPEDSSPMMDPGIGYTSPPDHTRSKTLNDLGNPPPQEGLGLGEFGEPGEGHRRFGSGPVRVGEDGPQRVGGSGQFSTFPVKARAGSAGGDQSFSASVADALGDPELSSAPAPSGGGAPMPSVNVGGNPWDGEEYAGSRHVRDGSQDSSQLPYTAPDQGLQYGESALSTEKGVRFRTPSMEVSGMGPIAPGVASPTYPSLGWRGRAPTTLYDAPVSPVRPEHEDEGQEVPRYEEEHARNSAAAREVARELDSLHFAPPSSPLQQHYAPPSPTIPVGLQPTRPLSINRVPSPLSPPSAPFAQPRSVSPNSTGSPRSGSPVMQPAPRGVSSLSLSPTGDGPTPYGTPPEYPAQASASATSLTAPAGGPRTISAAAFKRTARAGSDAELGKKRPLPSSPRPGPLRSTTGGSMDSRGHLPPGAQPPDYFLQEPGSPVTSDYGSLGNVRVANHEAGSPGYSQSKFVTHLDD